MLVRRRALHHLSEADADEPASGALVLLHPAQLGVVGRVELAQETLSQDGFDARRRRRRHAARKGRRDRGAGGLRLQLLADRPPPELRLAAMFIATDTTGTPTVYQHMVPYSFPVNAAERAINRLAQRFGRRADMLYVDWASLDLDRRLNWPVSRMMEFIYLDRATETHRDLRAVITHHIDVTTDPVLRYWTMVALKTLTATYADAIGRLAARVERQIGVPLPYLSLKLNPDPPALEPDPEADAIRFESLPVEPAIAEHATALVREIYQAVQRRLDAMFESARRGDYPAIA
jgi:hypothetical protein